MFNHERLPVCPLTMTQLRQTDLAADKLLKVCGVTVAHHFNCGNCVRDSAEIVSGELYCSYLNTAGTYRISSRPVVLRLRRFLACASLFLTLFCASPAKLDAETPPAEEPKGVLLLYHG